MTGEWIDMMTFEATYTIVDANVEFADFVVIGFGFGCEWK
jgi:hypothetical protein